MSLSRITLAPMVTYTPANPDPWKVEMGNVGQHYVYWRYGKDAALDMTK